ncbi:MAG TPA: NAD(P)H-dependent oxidoreductase subunit E [Conexibacter sp.]|nr:NAD(P)H-dependent oxidoreductase subunit E [Conexibacter sp.]
MSALSGGHGSELAGDVARYDHGSRIPGWDDAVDLTKDPAGIPDPALTAVPAELRAQIEASMAKYPDFRSAAIPALHAAQDVHGWCSPEAIEQVACVMRLTPAYLTAVATFYDMFSTEPVGRQAVYVCTNISCSLRGADKLYAAMQEAAGDDPDLNVRAFECLGACDIAPMASVNGAYVGPLELADAATIVAQLRAGDEVLPEKQLLRRKVADPRAASGGDDAGDATASAPPDTPPASAEAEHNASAAKAPDADHSDAADRLFPDEDHGA